jgi:CDGSH-type Zn-finger protein
MSEPKITIAKDGPYQVSGGPPLAKQHIVPNEQGESIEWRQGQTYPAADTYALCRCGHSGKKPFCDGTHRKVGFDGTETASRAPYSAQAKRLDGPEMSLLDAEPLCAFGRFCDPQGQVWNLVQRTDDPEAQRLVEHEAGHCPGGRLVALTRATGQALEPQLDPSIGLIEDTARGESGPIWVRGGIPVVGADGTPYEVRNRVTLCRCGASSNKPFCDGSHASVHFNDER